MRTIEDYFRSFAPANVQGARALSRAVDGVSAQNAEEEFFKQVIDLLFPPAPGEFKTAPELFRAIKDLGASNGRDGSQLAAAPQLAKLFRMYSTSLKGESPLESQITQFYRGDGGRPSAYNAINAKGEPVEVNNPFREMFPKVGESYTGPDPILTFLLIDAPSIDLKFRSAGKAEAFLNYVPSFIASSLVPYVDAEFMFNRSLTPSDSSGPIPITTMSPLKFLLGADSLDQNKKADMLMHDAAVRTFTAPPELSETGKKAVETARNTLESAAKGKAALEARTQKNPATNQQIAPSTSTLGTDGSLLQIKSSNEAKQAVATTTAVVRTGMELFTMPQTLINMDLQGASPRYNPVINPTAPFGVITGLTVDVKTNVGMAGGFKTANLTLKLFDRSRLVEIADFLSPKLFKAVTIWLTYGWRAPVRPFAEPGAIADVKTYYDFINENMLKREAYNVQNSSINIEKDGTVTVTLSLYSRGALELITSKDGLSSELEARLQRYDNLLAEMKSLAQRMGLQSVADLAKDVRGTTIISSALAGGLAPIDSKTLDREISGLKEILTKGNFPDQGKFLELVQAFYTQTGGTSTNARDVAVSIETRAISGERFTGLKSGAANDVFALPMSGQSLKKFDGDKEESPSKFALSRVRNWVEKNKGFTALGEKDIADRAVGALGALSFGRLFAHYFGQVALGLVNGAAVQEIQVIFYKLNDRAGLVSNINIAEFPIELAVVEEEYAKKIAEQKGENMSFNMLFEIVRASQFSSIQHPAYGFRDLYAPDKTTGQLAVKDTRSSDQLARRITENWSNGGPFVLPVLEMYIETGYTAVPQGYRSADLLDQFELAANSQIGGELNSARKIMRVHIYDKAATPTPEVMRVLGGKGGYQQFSVTALRAALGNNKELESLQKLADDVRNSDVEQAVETIAGATGKSKEEIAGFFKSVQFKDRDGNSSFELVKRKIAELVPTITMGTNGTMLESATFTTQQDALLSTIFMRRGPGSSTNQVEPNGSGGGDLPLRVIPGTLSVNSMGCPVLEYMQQFFVDMGTGTTVDNLYNVTGLTHTLAPGKFTTQIKFTFAEAYGQYEDPQSVSNGVAAEISLIAKELKDKADAEAKNKAGPANPPKPTTK